MRHEKRNTKTSKHSIIFTGIIVSIFILLTSASVSAQASDRMEITLAEKGLEGFNVNAKNATECATYEFMNPQLGAEFYPIITLNVELQPIVEGLAYVRATLNNAQTIEFKADDLKCTGNACVAHAYFDQNGLQETNQVNICIETGDTIARAELKDTSIIGFYKTPIFKPEQFTQELENDPVHLNKRTQVRLKVINSGSKSVLADVNFARPIVEQRLLGKNYMKVIGNTNFANQEIAAGEEKVFTYEILAEQPLAFSIPPAALTWKNVFGEEILLRTRPIITRTDQVLDVRAELLADPAVTKVGNTSQAKVFITNESSTELYNVQVTLNGQGMTIREGSTRTLTQIAPNETKEVEFTVSSLQAKEYTTNCSVSIQGIESVVNCAPAKFVFEDTNKTMLLLAQGIGLFIIGLLVIGWLNRPESTAVNAPVQKRPRFAEKEKNNTN